MTDPARPDALEARLPTMRAELYLVWVRFYRDINSRVLENPSLEQMAIRTGMPFVTGPLAEYVEMNIVDAVYRQALEARETGADQVAPVVRGSPDTLSDALKLMERRGRWIDEPGVLEALHVGRPAKEVMGLRARILEELRNSVAHRAMRPDAPDAD